MRRFSGSRTTPYKKVAANDNVVVSECHQNDKMIRMGVAIYQLTSVGRGEREGSVLGVSVNLLEVMEGVQPQNLASVYH